MNRCLIYIDEENYQNSLELPDAASRVYQEQEYETYAVCFSGNEGPAEGRFDYIISISDDRIKGYDIINITNSLEELQLIYHFDSILIPATYFGRMLAPRLARRLRTGLVADVTGIELHEGRVELIRPALSGKIMAGIINQNCTTLMMSIRPNVFSKTVSASKQTRTIFFKPSTAVPGKIKLLEIIPKEKAKEITESEVLVSGGGGTMEYFEELYLLAGELKALVSASRRIVDSGIAARSIQVGQSGRTVSPRLYIALGIYGSLQHMEGLKNVEYIISVNTNKDAPICSISDLVVEGDAREFIDKLIKKIINNRNREE